MKKLILLSIIIAFSGILKAQTFPYLNASTGNEGQYIVDADTNIIMFHDNQIEKLDKNFNPIWVKKYSGLTFHSLLLSKTGSLFFIATDTPDYSISSNSTNPKHIGKLDNTGNIVWAKTLEHPTFTNINVRHLLLDRNNDLMVSGEAENSNIMFALLLKLDTLGNMVYFKHFTKNYFRFSNVTILSDISGYYKCIYTDHGFENDNTGLFTYSEQGDSIFSQSIVMNGFPQHYFIPVSNYYKSRKDSNVFYSILEHAPGISTPLVRIVTKFKNNAIEWVTRFGAFNGANFINSFDEDENKNVIFTISPKYGPGYYHASFENKCFRLDSNGIFNGQYQTLLSYNWWPPSTPYESVKMHSLNNTYFYDVVAHNFSANPLSVTFLDSTLITNCSTSTAMSMTTTPGGIIPTLPKYIVQSETPPYPLTDINQIVSAITNFSINSNYCLVLNTNNLDDKNNLVEIYPNPVSNSLNINSNNRIIKSTIYDITGKIIQSINSQNRIDVSKLNIGLYLIKIKTDQGEFTQKFIKE